MTDSLPSETLEALTDAKAAATDQMNALILRWKTFAIDQRVVDMATRYSLSPTQANEMIAAARSDFATLDMDNQLAALAATLEKI
jgi:hypothetical protein